MKRKSSESLSNVSVISDISSESNELMCLICCEDIAEDQNTIQFRTNLRSDWMNLEVCSDCILFMKETQYKNYIKCTIDFFMMKEKLRVFKKANKFFCIRDKPLIRGC